VVLGQLWDTIVDPRILPKTCINIDSRRSLVNTVAFPVFRLVGCVVMVVWCWGLSLWLWSTYRVNALYVFELPPHNTAGYTEVFHLASHLTFGYFAFFLIYNKVRIDEFTDRIPQ
jgi:hypothetical protein